MANPLKEVSEVLADNEISLEEFDSMLKSAAIITHSLGNRRFHSWIFDVKGDVCLRMNPWIKEVTRVGSTNLVAYEDCEHCEGEGCQQCDFVGQLRVTYVPRQRSVKHEKSSHQRLRNR